MSFDEQPDGDPHGECAAEIHRLEQQRDELLAYNQTRTDELAAAVHSIVLLEQQRDELLDALEKVVAFWDSITMEDRVNDIHDIARAAIAKVKP